MKKLRDFIKCRELIFILTVYPALFILIFSSKPLIVYWANKNPVYYSFLIFLCSVLLCFFVILEIVTKVYNYEIQGDKLKIRQEEGINIEELNNGR